MAPTPVAIPQTCVLWGWSNPSAACRKLWRTCVTEAPKARRVLSKLVGVMNNFTELAQGPGALKWEPRGVLCFSLLARPLLTRHISLSCLAGSIGALIGTGRWHRGLVRPDHEVELPWVFREATRNQISTAPAPHRGFFAFKGNLLS